MSKKKNKINKSIYETEGWELFNKEVDEFVESIGKNIEGHLRSKFGRLEGIAAGEAIKRSRISMRFVADDVSPNKRLFFYVWNDPMMDGVLVPPDDEYIQSEPFYLMDFLKDEDVHYTIDDDGNREDLQTPERKEELIAYLNEFKRAVEYLERELKKFDEPT